MNTSIIESAVELATRRADQAIIAPLKNKTGAQVGFTASFIGKRSASEIRALIAQRWPDLSGNKLSAKVRDVMRGKATLSEQLMQASLVQLRVEADKAGKDICWTGMRANVKAGSVSLGAKLIKRETVVAEATSLSTPSLDEQLDSMSEEQAMAIVAKLANKFGA